MSCEQALELMSAALDGALSPEQEALLQAHLERCPECRRVMEAMKGLEQKLSALREPAPEGLKKGVLYRIDQATGKAKAPKRRWFGPGTAIGAVAAVLVLLVGLGVIPLKQRKTYDFDGSSYHRTTSQSPDAAPQAPENEAVEHRPDSLEAASLPASEFHDSNDNYAALALNTDSPSKDNCSIGTGSSGNAGRNESEQSAQPILSDALHNRCAELSVRQDLMVLLYTDFSKDSLFALLERAEPKLYALVEDLRTEETDGLILCETDCGSALAIHEWLLQSLPGSESLSERERSAENRTIQFMEELDPGSGSLFRVISWRPGVTSVSWPETWPTDWAARFRAAENWELFFPAEDYVPNSEKPAYLVFFPDP